MPDQNLQNNWEKTKFWLAEKSDIFQEVEIEHFDREIYGKLNI